MESRKVEEKVVFKLNKELDKRLINSFLNYNSAGVDFGEGLVRTHPWLSGLRDMKPRKRLTVVSRKVGGFYNSNEGKIKAKLEDIERSWRRIKDEFFREINSLFGVKRRKGKVYIAYMTVMNLCPRWTSKKEFCVSFAYTVTKNMLAICHEILHFYFYDYMNRKFPGALSADQKWIFSEVFNDVVMNQEQFLKFYRPIKLKPYPAYEKHFERYMKLYKGSKEISEFFRDGVRMAKKVM